MPVPVKKNYFCMFISIFSGFFFHAYILPIFDYADTCWSGLSASLAYKLDVHQQRLLEILFNKSVSYSSTSLYADTQTSSLSSRRHKHLCILVHKILLNAVPQHMSDCNWFSASRRSTRNNLCLPHPITLNSSNHHYFRILPVDVSAALCSVCH